MGQNHTSNVLALSCTHNGSPDEHAHAHKQLERLLQQLVERSSGTEALNEFEKSTKGKYKTNIAKWECLSMAIRFLSTWGKYRTMVAFAIGQIELANDVGQQEQVSTTATSSWRRVIIQADSYLNLARGNLMLSNFSKSCDYAQKCLDLIGSIHGGSNESILICGHAFLIRGKGYLGLSNLKLALESIEKSLSVAHSYDNKALECLACCAMAAFYLEVKDYEKATFFPTKASELLSEYGKEWNKSFSITTQLSLAAAYRKVGKLEEAMRTCEDVMQLALEEKDRLAQAYCMLNFADVHRVRKDSERSLPRYDAALGLMIETGHRYGQVLVAIGKAKAYIRGKEFQQALQQYSAGLQLAESIGCKVVSMRIHGELAVLYQRMSDQERARSNTLSYHRLMEFIGLFCGVCSEAFGEKHELLEALPCSHLFHLKCVAEEGILDTMSCPTCQKSALKTAIL
uniref:Rapsyn homolog n=1 Tax=Phallusia mammillata TaxID=59560 RepID=A0A6F9DQX5_9ASCI|nr:rapsyn homolog [Phallusia mammillata]